MKLSFVATVYNEEKSIDAFMQSIIKQSIVPDEIIIVDGGSIDQTVKKVQSSKFKVQSYNSKIKIFIKKGNRSVGRNYGIEKATSPIILLSDAGCILDKSWVKEISKPFSNPEVTVVAGYYQGKGKTVFEKSIIPYALVMPDKINPELFLPATRSMAFKKVIWKKVGKFNIKLSHNEDYAFAKKLQKYKIPIFFQKSALVYWMPRSNVKQAFIMFFRFAYGDAEAAIFRPKVLLLFFRYIVGTVLFVFSILFHSILIFTFLVLLILLYCLWAALKNYRYVKKWQAWYILPFLQFISDAAVIAGTSIGLINQL